MLNVSAKTAAATPASGRGPAPAGKPKGEFDPNARGENAKFVIKSTMAATGVKMGIESVRNAKSYHNAVELGMRKQWIVNALTFKPTYPITPLTGGPGNAWGKAYATVRVMSTGLGLAGLYVAAPNFFDARDRAREHGMSTREGVIGTKAGRIAILQGISGAIAVGTTVVAAWKGRKDGLVGMARSAVSDKWAAGTTAAAIGNVMLFTTIGNELRGLDFLNADRTGRT